MLAIQPDGGKVARAYAMQPEQEAANLYLPDPSVDPDIETFLSEASSFPGSPNDDEVDAMSQYVNWARKRSKTGGLAECMRAQYEALRGGLVPLPAKPRPRMVDSVYSQTGLLDVPSAICGSSPGSDKARRSGPWM